MGTDIGDFTVFACPHCTMPLRLSQQEAHCENNHLFDRSRDGYINLVVGGRLATTTTSGDTAESLRSRRDFFATGSYAPIASALASALKVTTGPVLDVGCGEVYYFTHINATEKYGIDISKKAVQMASKLLPDAHFAVASAFRLPIVDHSCAAVFSVFAPHSFEEYGGRQGRTGNIGFDILGDQFYDWFFCLRTNQLFSRIIIIISTFLCMTINRIKPADRRCYFVRCAVSFITAKRKNRMV